MEIKEIAIPSGYIERKRSDRCCRKVKSTGTSYFDGNKHQCGRLARFNVDGVNLCAQHAGEASLYYLLKQEQ